MCVVAVACECCRQCTNASCAITLNQSVTINPGVIVTCLVGAPTNTCEITLNVTKLIVSTNAMLNVRVHDAVRNDGGPLAPSVAFKLFCVVVGTGLP